MTIQEDLQKFLDNPAAIIVHHGRFTAKDLQDINKVLNGTSEDFLIFENAGGRTFFIWFNCVEFINHRLKEQKYRIYSYQIDGKQTILTPLSC